MEVHLCRPWGLTGAFKYPPGILAESPSIMQGVGRRVRGQDRDWGWGAAPKSRKEEMKVTLGLSSASLLPHHGEATDYHELACLRTATATYRDPDWVHPQQAITCLPWHNSFPIKSLFWPLQSLSSSTNHSPISSFSCHFPEVPQEKKHHNETLNPSSSVDPFLPKVARDSVSLPPCPLTSNPCPIFWTSP